MAFSKLTIAFLGLVAACDVGSTGSNGNGTSTPDAPGGGGGGGGELPDAPVAQPKLAMNVDKATVATELYTTEKITVTLVGSDGFAGNVTLAAQVVDGQNAVLAGFTATLAAATLNVPQNGQAATTIDVVVPYNAPATATVKITAASTVGEKTGQTALSIAKQFTLKIENDGNDRCKYPATAVANRMVTVGTKVRFLNAANTPLQIHVDGGVPGVAHQEAAMANGQAYVQTPAAVGSGVIGWYCHAIGPVVDNLKLQVVAQ